MSLPREHRPDASPSQRRTVHYRGRVQGVGFRYTAVRIAQNYQVRGFVQNLPDGRVRLVAEGLPDELDRFLEHLRRTMQEYIAAIDVQTTPAQGDLEGFGIRY